MEENKTSDSSKKHRCKTYKKSAETTSVCLECGWSITCPRSNKKLSTHVLKTHQFKDIEDYVIKHYFGGVKPACSVDGCENSPRRVDFVRFKQYCFDHSHLAEIAGGKIGGSIKRTWSKGKTKADDPRLLTQSIAVSGANNHFYGKNHTLETREKIASSKRLSFDEDVIPRLSLSHPDVIMVSSSEDYVDEYSLLVVDCKACGKRQQTTQQNIRRAWQCQFCKTCSRPQKDIADFITRLGFDVLQNDRRTIKNSEGNFLELDIYIPSKSFAVEHHGLYWHSGGRNESIVPGYHQMKHDLCQEKGIKLLQFFSDEWWKKREICESVIKNSLGCNDIKLGARECVIIDLDRSQADIFFDENHMSGHVIANKALGLSHPIHGLVAAISLRRPHQKKKWGGFLELARMAIKRSFTVSGAASRLVKQAVAFARAEHYQGFFTYADQRFGEGNVYSCCGLSRHDELTAIQYWYTDGSNRYSRFKYRAQDGKPEKLIALEAGVKHVEGCRNVVYSFTF